MTSVVARAFASSPVRPADLTWEAIVDLLTQGAKDEKRDELLAVRGTVASLIADQAPKEAAIIVTCEGPRTRIRCVYDDAAIEGDGVNEAAVSFDPLKGDWQVSLPCPIEDLEWVQASLSKQTSRITARDLAETTSLSKAGDQNLESGFDIDLKGFLS